MPRPPDRAGLGPEHDEGPAEVGDVRERVRRVGVAQDPGHLAGRETAEHLVAHGRVRHARTVEVGAPTDRGLDPAVLVHLAERVGDGLPNSAFSRRRLLRGVLRDWAVGRGVGVEVVAVNEPGAGGLGRGDGPAHERRERGRPFCVGRDGAVVDDGGPIGGFRSSGGVPEVAGHHGHAGREAGGLAGPVDGAGGEPTGGESGEGRPAERAGPEDDVEVGHEPGGQEVDQLEGSSQERRQNPRVTSAPSAP